LFPQSNSWNGLEKGKGKPISAGILEKHWIVPIQNQGSLPEISLRNRCLLDDFKTVLLTSLSCLLEKLLRNKKEHSSHSHITFTMVKEFHYEKVGFLNDKNLIALSFSKELHN